MTLKILVIGDPVAELKPGKETTLALVFEAQRRGFSIDHCTADTLCQTNGKVYGLVRAMRLNEDLNDHIHMGEERPHDLENYDIILMRSNPNGYRRMNAAYLLDILADRVFITNDPRGIRELHGKYLTGHFPDFIVPYAFVEHPSHLDHFLNRHNDVIIKPVHGYGGSGVTRLKEKPADIEKFFAEKYHEYDRHPFIVQEYIPAAVKGDKRIILFGGKPVCSLLRVPQNENSLANISQGAGIKPSELTLREKTLCAELGAMLDEHGLFFAGIDMLGDYLSEINFISVGTIVPANNLYGIRLEETFWDMLLDRYEDFKTAQH